MKNILVVDDSQFMRKWIRTTLQETKRYKVIAEASNGVEALVEYRNHMPDAIIMDLTMDEMDGVRALSILIKLFPSAKIIICSSMTQDYQIQECIQIGAKDFIEKPNIQNIVTTLDKIFYS